MNPSLSRLISAAVPMLVLIAAAARWLVEATEALRHPSGSGYNDLLIALAAWVLLGCAAWVVAIGAAAVVETTSAGRLPATVWVGCPPSLRRLCLAGLGVALVGVGPAQAPASASAQPPLPVPARPVGSVPTSPKAELVVRPGDTLWRLAADRLRSSATPGEVAALVRDLHDRNRGVIGPDPDLIRPGQRLDAPSRPNVPSSLTPAGRQEEIR